MKAYDALKGWFGGAAMVVACMALWRAESHAWVGPTDGAPSVTGATPATSAPTAPPAATTPVTPVAVPEPSAPRTTTPPVAPSPRVTRPAVEGLRVRRLVLARGVAGREPVSPTTTFRAADAQRVFAFVELENRGDEAEVRVRFEPRDEPRRAVGHVALPVPGGRAAHRTWAYTRMARRPGAWVAVVETDDGRELARAPFTVE